MGSGVTTRPRLVPKVPKVLGRPTCPEPDGVGDGILGLVAMVVPIAQVLVVLSYCINSAGQACLIRERFFVNSGALGPEKGQALRT